MYISQKLMDQTDRKITKDKNSLNSTINVLDNIDV